MKNALLSLIVYPLVFSAPAYADDNQIIIKDHAFTPSTLTVAVGTKVTWTNHDDDPHTVADNGSKHQFRSRALDTNESYSYTFTNAGIYQYFCTMHPVMSGKIIVSEQKQ